MDLRYISKISKLVVSFLLQSDKKKNTRFESLRKVSKSKCANKEPTKLQAAEIEVEEIRSFYSHNSSTSVTLQDAAGIRTSQCLFLKKILF